jgi:dynein heavy chain
MQICFKVTLRKGYSSADLKLDLANLYQKTGLKNLGTVFLMTDAQVADEKFLVLINNLLASGEIPDLFGDDEVIDLRVLEQLQTFSIFNKIN